MVLPRRTTMAMEVSSDHVVAGGSERDDGVWWEEVRKKKNIPME